MRKPIALWSLIALASVAFPSRSPAPVTYRPGEGAAAAEEDFEYKKTGGDQMAVAERYEKDGQWGRALGAYKSVARRFSSASFAPKAQFKTGEMLFKMGDYSRAFDAYQRLIDRYPKSDDFDEAIAGQYKVANRFLEGQRQKVLGVPTLPSMDRAATMFEKIVKNGPFSDYAPLAQFGIGQAREKDDKLEEAIAAYQVVVEKYPNSTVAGDAQYQIGYVWMTESRGGAYDQTAAEKAREAFTDFIARYPKSAKVPQAQENMKNLGGSQTRSAFDIAKFYDKQKSYKAAVIYYNDVIRQQPESAQANTAKKRIEELRKLVGDDSLRVGTEKAETGARAQVSKKFKSQVDTAARPDYVGPPPPAVAAGQPDAPRMRTGPGDVSPLLPLPPVEPPLPGAAPLPPPPEPPVDTPPPQ